MTDKKDYGTLNSLGHIQSVIDEIRLDKPRHETVEEFKRRLKKASDWFAEYAEEHDKKGKSDKMQRNRERAFYCLTGKLEESK
jgi:lysyl-tRNA synthetase class I